MFQEFENQVWTPNDPSNVFISDFTSSLRGQCKKVIFGLGSEGESVTVSFDEVDLSLYEEISFYIYLRQDLREKKVLKLIINGQEYLLQNLSRAYHHVLIDTVNMGTVSNLQFVNLTNSCVFFIDLIGYRSVDYASLDRDLIGALKQHIELDYNFKTEITAAAQEGEKQLAFLNNKYIFDSSMIEIRDDQKSEHAHLWSKDGELLDPLANSYSAGAQVRVLCPVLLEDFEDLEPDPVCGIVITDFESAKEFVVVKTLNGVKIKRFLGRLGITIYIDCQSTEKVWELTRQYEAKYGERFTFLLDGELVDIYLEDSGYIDNEIGNNPRTTFFYRITPQPVTIMTNTKTFFKLNIESEAFHEA